MNTQVLFYLILLIILAYVLNIPFGLFRQKFERFSIGWFACIHAPIPIIAFIRISSHISLKYIPLLVIAAIAGQMTGYRIKNKHCQAKSKTGDV